MHMISLWFLFFPWYNPPIKKEQQPKLNIDLPSTTDFLMLLEKLHYKAGGQKRTDGECQISLSKGLNYGHPHSRFHMVLAISLTTHLPEIKTFHLDQSEHRSIFLGWSAEETEIKQLIKSLDEEEKSETQYRLLSLFNGELLFGAARELNKRKGFTHKERFRGLLTNDQVGEFRFSRRKRDIEDDGGEPDND